MSVEYELKCNTYASVNRKIALQKSLAALQCERRVCWGSAHKLKEKKECKLLTTIAVSTQCKALSALSLNL
jgi:hypothetical protein